MEPVDPAAKKQFNPSAPTRRPRGFKITLIVVAALLVLVAAVIYFLPHFLPVDTIKGIANTQARAYGLDVDFQNLRFGWNGDVVLDNVAVRPLLPDGSPDEPLLLVNEVRTNVALTPLLRGNVIVNSVNVNGFTLGVVRRADGSLNLPDLENLPAQAATVPTPVPATTVPLSMVQAAEAVPVPAASTLPPIELHRVEMQNGIISFNDAVTGMRLESGLERLRVDGTTLNDPFALEGLLVPHVGQPELGRIPFSGNIALLRDNAFDPAGQAQIQVALEEIAFAPMAEIVGMADLLRQGVADGHVRIGYSGGSIALAFDDLVTRNVMVGLGAERTLAVPDTSFALDTVYDAEADQVSILQLAVANDIASLTGQGAVQNVMAAANGAMPAGTLDFGGSTDLTRATGYLAASDLGLDAIPDLKGDAEFTGKAVLPANLTGGPITPTLALDFTTGTVQVTDGASGIIVSLDLDRIGFQAAAALQDPMEINANLTLVDVQGRAIVPSLVWALIPFTLNGGVAAVQSADTTAAELRLQDTTLYFPETPFSNPAEVITGETRITADVRQDVITIAGIQAKINDAITATVGSGTITGIMAGAPAGQVTVNLAAAMPDVRHLAEPVFPADLVQELKGSVKASAQLQLRGNTAEALVRTDIDALQAGLALGEGVNVATQMPQAIVQFLAGVDLTNPGRIIISSLEAVTPGGAFTYGDRTIASSAAAQVANSTVKAVGTVDTALGVAEFTALTVDVGGTRIALGSKGQTVAQAASGPMQIIAASGDKYLRLPLASAGDFVVSNLQFGMDNLIFQHRDTPSNLGNVRANIAVDGYIGAEKRQLVNLRQASITATPIVAEAQGQFDIGSGALLAQYAARLAPSGLTALLSYLNMPPALLSDTTVSGTMTYGNSQVISKGTASGSLSGGDGGSNPFEMAHDLTAAWDTEAQSLAIDVRQLDGNIRTPDGNAVATMAAQPSRLLLSRAGSRGLLDLRFNGSAAQSQALLVGLSGMVPQLAEHANALHQARADGIYNLWLQVRALDSGAIGLSTGGTWQGAALQIGNQPFLAEAGSLSAVLEGEVALQDNQIRLTRLGLLSESAQVRADGTALVTLSSGEDGRPNGLANLDTNFRFAAADASRISRVFPGIVAPELGVTGAIEGTLRAGGNASDIQVQEGAVRFANFAVQPNRDFQIAIPNGAATFGAAIALRTDSPTPGTPFDMFHLMDIRNGQASLQGAQVLGRNVDDMSAAFSLENGVLTLQGARVLIGNGTENFQAAGTVDFNTTSPSGINSLNMDVQFAVADVGDLARMMPDLAAYGLSGRIDGALQAGGNADNIRIGQGVVRMQNFSLAPSPSLVVAVPNGAASFGATLSLHFGAQPTGSPYDILRQIDIRDGVASLQGAQISGKNVDDLSASFALQNGILTLGQARVSMGGGAAGTLAATGTIDFNSPAPAVNTQVSIQNLPLSEFNAELAQYMTIEQGTLQVPASGGSAGVAFRGFSENEILQTLALSNFTFATGPLALNTGPVLNAELDRARVIMRQEMSGASSRRITFL
ncbi:MAG: AsmA family protein, partial [Planctomycetaceae bacterium]|nr:AsmA family protein [Planctomycetaceae bacterium]